MEDKELWKLYKNNFREGTSSNCPDDYILAEYADGNASQELKDEIENHISLCINCTEKLKDLRLIQQESFIDAPHKIKQKAKSLVSKSPVYKENIFIRIYNYIEMFINIRPAFAYAAVSVFMILVCLTGFNLGEGIYSNNQIIKTGVISDFSLQNNLGAIL